MQNHSNSALFAPEKLNGRTSDHVAASLELAAWRFLAAHRAGALQVSYVEFFDDAGLCRMRAPSAADIGCHEGGAGETFGHAAIALAVTLGMPWDNTDSLISRSVASALESSARIAIRRAGEKSKNSRRTRSRKTGSTTGATSAGAPTDAGPGRGQRGEAT